MTQKEFIKKLKDIVAKHYDIEKAIETAETNSKKIKFYLELLGYNTNMIALLTNGKDLGIYNSDMVNDTIARKIRENKEIYSKLIQLKQLVK